SSRRRHTRCYRDWSSDVCSSDLSLLKSVRGWGHYYKRAHVRTLFNKLDHWIERRIWSHRYKRWRNCGWRQLPKRKLNGEFGLVRSEERRVGKELGSRGGRAEESR